MKKAVHHQDMYLENCILIMKDQDIKPPAEAERRRLKQRDPKDQKNRPIIMTLHGGEVML